MKNIEYVQWSYTNDKDYKIFDNEEDNLNHVFELLENKEEENK